MSRMQRKLREYLDFGVKYVWVIDPEERRGWIYTAAESHEALDGVLRTNDPEIILPLAEVLPEIANA